MLNDLKGDKLMKGVLKIIAVVLIVLVVSVFILGTIWQQTDHGTLDFKAAVILKIRNAFLKDEPLTPAKIRADANSRAKTLQGQPKAVAKIQNIKISASGGKIPLRVYTPPGGGPFPILIFYHGGGWVIGDLDTADTACRFLANRARCLVISVDYRLAPEHPFPAAVEDAYSALQWVAAHGRELKGDPVRMAVSGSSSGGNLCAAVALMSRDRDGPKILYQVLIYPATDLSDMNTDSHRFFGKGYGLTRKHMIFFVESYLPDVKTRLHPYVSPLLAENLAGLPPAMVITAGFDILRDEGKAYADRLKRAGVETIHTHYPTMIHGFVTMDRIFKEAGEALTEVSDVLKNVLYDRPSGPDSKAIDN